MVHFAAPEIQKFYALSKLVDRSTSKSTGWAAF